MNWSTGSPVTLHLEWGQGSCNIFTELRSLASHCASAGKYWRSLHCVLQARQVCALQVHIHPICPRRCTTTHVHVSTRLSQARKAPSCMHLHQHDRQLLSTQSSFLSTYACIQLTCSSTRGIIDKAIHCLITLATETATRQLLNLSHLHFAATGSNRYPCSVPFTPVCL